MADPGRRRIMLAGIAAVIVALLLIFCIPETGRMPEIARISETL